MATMAKNEVYFNESIFLITDSGHTIARATVLDTRSQQPAASSQQTACQHVSIKSFQMQALYGLGLGFTEVKETRWRWRQLLK